MHSDGRMTSAIAIIGMAVNVPGAENLEEFWSNLKAGRESFGPLSDDELAELGMDHTARLNPNWIVVRGFPNKPKEFDAGFFGIPPGDALLMDPQQRFLLECGQNAFDDAGYDPQSYEGRIGAWAGTGTSGYYNEFLEPAFRNQPQQQFNSIILNDFHFPATRLAHCLNLTGPVMNVATACSTGLVATHYACQALRRGECEMALVGVSRINPGAYSGYPRLDGMIYSSDGHCRVFDSRADGTVFTNGTAAVLLKRLDRALADRDNIRAVILGSAVNNDGNVKLSFTAPSIDGQEAVLEDAYEDAGVDPTTISFVEGHGTATLLGDPIEVNALTRVFRRRTDRRGFCWLGSVKSNIGHLEVAAGIAGLVKGVLALEKREIPGTLHFTKPNPALELEASPFKVNAELVSWTDASPLRAGVSSFGIGGTNAHLVLEEAPRATSAPSRRRRHVLPVSARTVYSRDAMVQRLQHHLQTESAELADVAYTLQTGRRAFPVRAAVTATTAAEAATRLQQNLISSEGPIRRGVASIWMFSGQGSQYVGMTRGLYEEETVFRSTFDHCAQRLQPLLDADLRSLVLEPSTQAAVLEQTRIAQPALFSVEIAMARQLAAWGMKPSALIGHSIGEYAAACIAGVFELDDALDLVAVRGALMQSLPPGSMIAVNAPAQRIESYLSQEVCLAAINSPEHCVLSGPSAALERILPSLTEAGFNPRKLHTSHAFHSSMMEPILEEFANRVARVPRQAPEISFVSNLTGTWIEDEQATDPAYWSQHLRNAVRFADGLTALCESRPNDVLAELGPSTTLCQLAGLHDAASTHPRVALGRHTKDTRPDAQVFLDGVAQMWVAGADVDWNRFYGDEERRRVSLPPYVFQREEYFFKRGSSQNNGRRYDHHPLLGKRHPSAVVRDATVFDAAISTFTPDFLLHHTIFETPLVPAACYAEVALAAGKNLLRTDSLTVSELTFEKPMSLPRGTQCQLQTVVTREPDGGLRVRLFALPPGESGHGDQSVEWEEHATARVSVGGLEGRDASADLAAWKARITERVPAADLYDTKQIGFRWGPPFQTVTQAFVRDWEVLARIELPSSLEHESKDFFFHPCLLDGCFQLAGRAVPRERLPGLIMPTSAERFLIRGPVPSRFWVHLQGRPERTNAQGITLDFTLVGDDGQEFARIEGFLELSITQSTLIEAGARVNTWFHKILWREMEKTAASGSAANTQLVLFADTGGLAARVAAKALQAGSPAPILVYRGDLPAETPPGCECVKLTLDSEAAVIERLSRITAPIAAAHLWSTEPAVQAVDLCSDLVTVIKTFVGNGVRPRKLLAVTRGAQQVDTEAIVNLDQAAIWGLQRVVMNEQAEIGASLMDLDGQPSDLDADAAVILGQLLALESRENQMSVRQNRLLAARLARVEKRQSWRKGPFAVRLGGYGSLDSLNIEPLRPSPPGKNQVKIRVQASAVNFRDVLQVMGAMRAFNEAAGILDPAQVPIGFECAGEVLETGEQVTGLAPGDRVLAFGTGCHTSHYTVDASQVVRIPDRLHATEAVALPTVLVTALYGLDRLAKLKAGDRVLIHSCAGGVGQAALRVARRAGATVFATASPSKWDMLREQGVEHVFSSRNLDFARGILEATGGQGVDVILNALNGEFIEKNLSILAPNGRFVEIGKIGTWSAEQMARARPDVQYFKFDLYEIGPALFRSILEQGLELVSQGALVPLPIRKFPIRDIVSAFRWLAQGQNVGKAVLEMPEDADSLVRKDRTYLITGGLGALGLVMANGLVESGARHVALIGRGDPKPAAQEEIRKLVQAGAEVRTFQCDISSLQETQALFAALDSSMPPLGGILHAAGVLDDGVIVRLDRQRFERVMASKVSGARNLHQLTLDRNLDFFVLFSSISATLGAAGQGNYAAANAYMDMLAAARTARGLPGLSIGWGAWAAVGMAAELVERFTAQRAAVGLKDIPPAEGVIALNALLQTGAIGHVVAMPVQWSRYLAQYARSGAMPPLFTDLAAALQLSGEGGGEDTASNEDISFVTEVRGADPATRMRLLKAFLSKQVAATVGSDAGLIEDHSTLAELGVDSLIAMELRTRVNRSIGVQLPLSILVGSITISEVAAKLAEAFQPEVRSAA